MDNQYILNYYDLAETKISPRNHLSCKRTIDDEYYFRHLFLWDVDELGSVGIMDGTIIKRFKNLVIIERRYSFKEETMLGIFALAKTFFDNPINN